MQDFKISADAKRATKKIAYEMAIKLKQGEVLSDKELDSLLLYFAPSAPKVAKTAIEWVAKAVATNDIRYYLNFIRVQDGFAYGTDGHRIHRAVSDLPTGFYCPKTLALVNDVGGTYPRVAEVMTRLKDADNTRATLGELTKGVSAKKPYLLHEGLDVAISANYITSALNSSDDSSVIEYEPYNSGYRIHGSNEHGVFVVMPMRV